MQNQEMNRRFVLLSVPLEVLAEAGILTDGVLEMYADGSRLVIQNADTDGFVCGGNCEECPIILRDCTGECAICPCNENDDESEVR